MELAFFRIPLYIALWICSFLLLCFTAARLQYTTHLPKGDPLNRGIDFYDPIVAELLVCSILTLGTIPFVLRLIHRILLHPLLQLPRNLVEPIVLSVLWLLWLVGASVSSSIFGDLSWCSEFEACRILSAMMAFAWLGWIGICGLGVLYLIPFVENAKGTARATAAGEGHSSMRQRDLPQLPV